MTADPDRAAQAIVLSGGGAYGAYGIGVMEALLTGRWQRGRGGVVEPNIFTGTSVGSINAAYMASASGPRDHPGCLKAVRDLRKVWLERIADQPTRPNSVMRMRGDVRAMTAMLLRNPAQFLSDFGEDVGFFTSQAVRGAPKLVLSQGPASQRFAEQVDFASLISVTPLRQLLTDIIDPAAVLHSQARTLAVAATSWDSGKVVVFSNLPESRPAADETTERKKTRSRYDKHAITKDNLVPSVLASAAIPGVFPPVPIGTDKYVDGGVLMNTPLNPAIDARAKTLHLIYLDPELERSPRGDIPSTLSTLDRILAVTFANIKGDVEYARLTRSLIRAAKSIQRSYGSGSRSQDPDVREFLERFAHREEITVHSHFPSRGLGGITGMLNFNQQPLIDLMELGFDDTVNHDCQTNGCLVD